MSFVFSQSNNWWIFFNDKDCDQLIELSDRAIDRRMKQNINFDVYDVSVCQHYIDSLIKYDLKIRHKSKWLNAVSVSVLSDSHDKLKNILELDFVKDVRSVKTLKKQRQINILNSDKFHEYNLRTSSLLSYGSSFNQIDMLGGVDLHNQGFLGNNIIIAVFDAGFTSVNTLPIFDNLWTNNQILDLYDFVDNDYNVFEASSHGTMVLSTMGGYMTDSLIGTAPFASYMLFRTEDSNSETLLEEDNWAAAAEYADSAGVDIINSSLGYTILYDDLTNSHSYSDMDGNSTIITNSADLAASRGILVVNSAGNSGNNDWYYIGAPADGDSVLAVGAVSDIGEIASFSSRGPSFDGRVKPNVCAQGVLTVVADLDSTIRVANGTSFAAPLISGLAACLWEANSSWSNMDLLNHIEESAHLFLTANDSLGYGIPNFYNAYQNGLQLGSNKNTLHIYPNPFQIALNIYNDYTNEFQFDIFNLFGEIVYSYYSKNSHVRIHDLGQISPGIYYLKIRGAANVYPIIKIK